MIVWFWHQITPSFVSCCKLDISMFYYIFHSFSKKCIMHQLGKIFFKVIFCIFFSSVFIPIYCFNQAFRLNLITLCFFFGTNSWFSACFKVLICTTYFFFLFKLHTSFSRFSILIISSKNGRSLWSLSNIQVLNVDFKEIPCITIFIVYFYEVFIKLRCIFNPLKTIYR